MGKVRSDFNLSNLNKDPQQLARFVSILRDDLVNVINGELEFDQNLKTSQVTANFTAANTQIAITHTLGRIPLGYILTKTNVATSIYDGGTANTDTFLYVKASVIANTKLLVF
jgi:hypothetical protein